VIQEAINKIESLVRRAYGAEVLHSSAFPKHVILRKGDELEFKDTPTPMLRQGVTSLRSLCAAAGPASQFWVSRTHAIVLSDPMDPREWVAMPLYATYPWKLIRELERQRMPGKSFTPRECLRFFRHELGEACNVDSTLAGALSILDFKRMTGLHQGASRERDSFGKSVEVEVQGAAQIPDFTNIRVPMFNNPGCQGIRCDVTLDIILDPEKECVRLVPRPDHVVQAEIRAAEEVLNEIRDLMGDQGAVNGSKYLLGTPVVSIEGLPGSES